MAPKVAILGAGGLIGQALALDLMRRGFAISAFARHFSSSQRVALQGTARQTPLVSLDDGALAGLLADADIVVNCLGVLQGAQSEEMHHAFVTRLAACCVHGGKLLVHLSVPGKEAEDRTPFSLTKRAGEQAIAASGAAFVILRPGFVVGQAAYGGSALMRALHRCRWTCRRARAGRPSPPPPCPISARP